MASGPLLPGGARLTIRMGPLTTSPVPAELARALQEVQVTTAAGQRSGFQLRFQLARGGYVERQLLAGGYFTPPTRVILVVTIDGRPQVLSDGVIGRVDVGESGQVGASTLTISGSDLSQMMDLIDLSGVPMPGMPAIARVYAILAKYGVYGVIPMAVPSVLDAFPNPLEKIPAQQGTDYSYLAQLADQAGYVFYLEPGPSPGMNIAYWGPEFRLGPPQRALRVNMGSASNVDQLQLGFDGIRKTLFAVWIQNKETKFPIPVPLPDFNPLSPLLGAKYIIPRAFQQLGHVGKSDNDRTDAAAKFDVATALSRGLARAAQSANVVTASGTLDARRYGGLLLARQFVNVQGATIDFDGQYFVRSVTTTLKRGAMTQSFSLERNALGPPSNRIQVG